MPRDQDQATCPHCGALLSPFKIPQGSAAAVSGWDEPVHWACFDDDCSYYREGWDWMWEQFEVKASYRYRIRSLDRAGSKGKPLAVWSPTALRDLIIDED